MKIVFALLLASLPAALFAAEPHYSSTPEVATISVPDGWLTSAVKSHERIRANVSEEHADWFLVFPIVGSTAGSGGTFFRSETTLVNNLTRPQTITVFFFPANGGSCAAPVSKRFTLDSFSWYVYPDIMSNLFNAGGLGSIIVIATSASGSPDPSGSLDGFSRIWTPISGFGGTASQSFAPVIPNVINGTQTAYGIRQDANFRMNIGIFNYAPTGSTAPRLFDIGVYGINGSHANTVFTVAPCSMLLTAAPAGNFGNALVQISPRDGGSAWYGFASSVDNISGDNWSSTARQ